MTVLQSRRKYCLYPCLVCLSESRPKDSHWAHKTWPERKTLQSGTKNIIHGPLVSWDKIILPPLNIKLGLMKQYVRGLDKDEHFFRNLCSAFPGLSKEILKAQISDGPKIEKMSRDKDYMASMTVIEKWARTAFVDVVNNFLWNRKASSYIEIVNELLASFELHGCNMSVKIHSLISYLDKFPKNLGNVSDKQQGCFQQDFKVMKELYQGRWDIHNGWVWIILENPENEIFYLYDLISCDCKVCVCLIMLFSCLMWSF